MVRHSVVELLVTGGDLGLKVRGSLVRVPDRLPELYRPRISGRPLIYLEKPLSSPDILVSGAKDFYPLLGPRTHGVPRLIPRHLVTHPVV